MLLLLELVRDLRRRGGGVRHHRAVGVEGVAVLDVALGLRQESTHCWASSIDHVTHRGEVKRAFAHASPTIEHVASHSI